MMMKSIRFSSVPIPSHWTAQQAQAVIGFLEDICLAIWDVHEQALIEAENQQESAFKHIADEGDEIPF